MHCELAFAPRPEVATSVAQVPGLSVFSGLFVRALKFRKKRARSVLCMAYLQVCVEHQEPQHSLCAVLREQKYTVVAAVFRYHGQEEC